MIDTERLAALEEIVDRSGVARRLESLLSVGVRPRQLSMRTLVIGIMAALGDQRPAHLTRVHAALVGLAEHERRRLGVVVDWLRGPHLLSYRQVERTFGLLVAALDKEYPNGRPSQRLGEFVDDLIEASVPGEYKQATSALAVDWTDAESFALPPALKPGNESADPEASWGHRRGDSPGQTDELFFGYHLQLATMVSEEKGSAVPELVRRILLTACHVDPPPAFVAILENMAACGVPIGDVLADSGYSHRVPEHWALPLRALGANIITDLHPSDRGPRAPSPGRSVAMGTCIARPPPRRSLASNHSHARRARRKPPPTTHARPNWPATSWGASVSMTRTATTA